jgi:hypothetical protein
MKMELLRNCWHGSEIATYRATDESGGKIIIKVSTTPGGIKNLYKEVEGWRWYQKLRYPAIQEPLCLIVQEYKSYLKVKINYIDGDKPVYQTGLEGNKDIITRAVQHYCQIWPRSSDLSPMHGDFSLDNIIINSNGVHVIDWEHFTTDIAPWGFDILYLLFELLYFSMYLGKHQHYKPTSDEIRIICEHIKTINTCQQLQPDILKAPLKFVRGFILANNHLWGEQFALYQIKLPVVIFSSEQITVIDEMIGSRMAKL